MTGKFQVQCDLPCYSPGNHHCSVKFTITWLEGAAGGSRSIAVLLIEEVGGQCHDWLPYC
jgi:hypothetical protein